MQKEVSRLVPGWNKRYKAEFSGSHNKSKNGDWKSFFLFFFFFFLVGTARRELNKKVTENLLQWGYTLRSVRVHILGKMRHLNTISEWQRSNRTSSPCVQIRCIQLGILKCNRFPWKTRSVITSILHVSQRSSNNSIHCTCNSVQS